MRTVSELMQLGTYQGMTDEEIELIIDHVFTTARNDGYEAGRNSAHTELLRERNELERQMAEDARARFATNLARPLVLQEVTFNE